MPASTLSAKRPEAARCSATTRFGKRCKAIAGSDGLCAIHGGRQDPRELGRKGGRGRTRNQDGAVAASELGRARLIELTQSDDPKVAISASRALFSYGPQKPPEQERAEGSMRAQLQLLRRLEALELLRITKVEETRVEFVPVDLPKLRKSCDAAWRDAANAYGDARAKNGWQ
jgi:hypothetical protein